MEKELSIFCLKMRQGKSGKQGKDVVLEFWNSGTLGLSFLGFF